MPEVSVPQLRSAAQYIRNDVRQHQRLHQSFNKRGRSNSLRRSIQLVALLLTACNSSGPRIEVIQLEVSDVDRAINFYSGVFGWEASHPDSSYAILAAEPTAIGLIVSDSVIPGNSGIVLAVSDLESVHGRVLQHGGVIVLPISPSWQGRQFRFADADGNEMVVWSESGDGDAGGGTS